MCIKQQAVRKFVLAQNVTITRDTFTSVSQFLAAFFLWKIVLKLRKGWSIFKHDR